MSSYIVKSIKLRPGSDQQVGPALILGRYSPNFAIHFASISGDPNLKTMLLFGDIIGLTKRP